MLTKEEMLRDAVLAERRGELPAAVAGPYFFRGLRCGYLTPNGNKCLIGRHIPDGHKGQHERGDVALLLIDNCDLGNIFPDDETFLTDLQDCHDLSCFVEWGEIKFDRVQFHSMLDGRFPKYAAVLQAAREELL